MPLDDRRLIRVGKATAAQIEQWKEGVSLERDAGRDVDALRRVVAAARWQLAYGMRRDANAQMRRSPPLLRSAISRYYYAMYHALRAATYVAHEGDDHEAHAALPKNVP